MSAAARTILAALAVSVGLAGCSSPPSATDRAICHSVRTYFDKAAPAFADHDAKGISSALRGLKAVDFAEELMRSRVPAFEQVVRGLREQVVRGLRTGNEADVFKQLDQGGSSLGL